MGIDSDLSPPLHPDSGRSLRYSSSDSVRSLFINNTVTGRCNNVAALARGLLDQLRVSLHNLAHSSKYQSACSGSACTICLLYPMSLPRGSTWAIYLETSPKRPSRSTSPTMALVTSRKSSL